MTRTIHAAEFSDMPRWFRMLNRIWKITYPLGTKIKLDKDELILSARKSTGLYDLGKEFWDEPLDRLIRSINEEARLNPIGSFITRKRLINLLTTRLRAEWWFKKEPHILQHELYPVLLIAGLQRTGTTKLQRLLSADPDARSLSSWEALSPAPPVRGPDRRKGFAKTSEKALKYMAPGFFAIHPVEHLSQEEDILLLDVSFLSTTPEATMEVPSYATWLEKTDQSPAYAYAVKLLKLLQWQHPAHHWVLKSPHHLEFFDLIDQYFGDVVYLWTHRELASCIPSFLSMVAHGRAIFSDSVDIDNIAKHWMNKTRYMLNKAIAFRKSIAETDRFIDIHYRSFIDQPMETIRTIYSRSGISLDPHLENRLTLFEKSNSKGKYGYHQYSLRDFGLNEDMIKTHYKAYLTFKKELGTNNNL